MIVHRVWCVRGFSVRCLGCWKEAGMAALLNAPAVVLALLLVWLFLVVMFQL